MVRLLALLLLLSTPLAAQGRDSLHLELVLDPRTEAPLEGEMILATIRGIYRETIANEQLKLRGFTDFDWTRLGQDSWTEQRIDGRAARVFERRMAFFAKRAGTLDLLPIVHELEIIGAGGRRETVLTRSAPVRITVGARPAGAGADWLPVRALELSDTWNADAARLDDGQSVTRRVVIRALGATPEMMPPQPPLRAPWLITFAPPVQRDFQITAQGPVTTDVWTWTLRPTTGEPGVLAPVTIPYFDTGARTARTATLPAAPIGYASFADNAALGWRGDVGVGRAHLAVLGASAVLVVILSARGRAGASTAVLRLRTWIARRRDLGRLRRHAARGEAERFRTLARRLLDPEAAAAPDEPHPTLRGLDAMIFGGKDHAGAVDLRALHRAVRRQVLGR